MNFGFDETTSEVTATGKFIPAGIQDNITLKNVEFLDDAGNGNPALEITFEDSEGRTVNKRYFDPSKSQYDPQKAVNKFNKVAKNIATKFLGDNATLSGTDFKSFSQNLIAQLTPHFGSATKLRVKVILNNADYPTLPGYAPICELMTVPKDQTQLKINPDWNDRVEPVAATPTDTEGTGEAGGAPWSMGS
jgi:hypothetical protein